MRTLKRSIDARHRDIFVNLKVRVYINEVPHDDAFVKTEYPDVSHAPRVIVVGAGPGGLFAALRLVELGLRPIVLERGKDVRERKKDLAQISRTHTVDPESNYCFGEGGAGAYSDGKLYTRSKKRGSVEKILNVFCQHGASTSILADAHPHIGTDKLPKVIENMRNTILACGGEVHFQTKMVALETDGNKVVGVKAVSTYGGGQQEKTFKGAVILATGHSARDVYQHCQEANIEMEAKGIAVGVRLEHPAELIDQIQYHNKNGRGKYLPAAEYAFVTQVEGRGVYSFCMCPGGIVIPASTEQNCLAVNGMSYSMRAGKNANSAILVQIPRSDFDQGHPLDGFQFQKKLEQLGYYEGFAAPAQNIKDYLKHTPSDKLVIPTSYPRSTIMKDMHAFFSDEVNIAMEEGMKQFDKRIHGWIDQGIMIGLETRSSSPIKILRNDDGSSSTIQGLYPCGEGAGYAGGIVSSAVDGIKQAENYIAHLNQ